MTIIKWYRQVLLEARSREQHRKLKLSPSLRTSVQNKAEESSKFDTKVFVLLSMLCLFNVNVVACGLECVATMSTVFSHLICGWGYSQAMIAGLAWYLDNDINAEVRQAAAKAMYQVGDFTLELVEEGFEHATEEG